MPQWPHESNEAELEAFYGNPRGAGGGVSSDWETASLTKIIPPWQMTSDGQPVSHITIHIKCADSFTRILTSIWDHFNHDQNAINLIHMNEFDGSFNYRQNVNSPGRLSMHAYAAACDFAAKWNPNGKPWVPNSGMMDPAIIDIFHSEDWEWGNEFSSTKDGMHFQATYNPHRRPSPTTLPPIVVSPPIVPTTPTSVPTLPVDQLARMRAFLLSETGLTAELVNFKSQVTTDLTALIKKINDFEFGGYLTPPPSPGGPAIPPVAPQIIQQTRRFINITVTEFGGPGDPQRSAYDNKIIDPNIPQVALPAKVPESQRQVKVSDQRTGRSVICKVNDIGPWNTHDEYWLTAAGRPLAEQQFNQRLKAQDGHVPSNNAGLDMTPGGWAALGLSGTGKDHLDWEFYNTGTGGSKMSNGVVTVPVISATASKINWTQIVSFGATMLALFTGNKFNLDPSTQVALVAGIQGIQSLVTVLFRTFGTTAIVQNSITSQ